MDSNANTVSEEFSRVLRDEIERLRPEAHDPNQSPEACADRAQLMGLAFSGGGIRSATFCLGVIQALARLRLLHGFDYLSTVSGGGYIGAWLSALIFRSRKPGQSVADALAAVEQELGGKVQPWCTPGTPAPDCPPEHPSLRFLRRYSNYLTPRMGIFSGDSLAAFSTYLRNLLLNQLILVAFFGALLTLPYLLLNLGRWLTDPQKVLACAISLARYHKSKHYKAIERLLAAAIAAVLRLMRFDRRNRFNLTGPRFVAGLIVLPSLISAWLFALTLQAHAGAADYTKWDWMMWTALAYAAPWALVFSVTTLGLNDPRSVARNLKLLWTARDDHERGLAAGHELFGWAWVLVRFGFQLVCALLAGAVGGLIFYGLRNGAELFTGARAVAYATTFGTPLVLLSYSLVVMLHIGLMKRLFSDQDREWWARLGGFIAQAAVIWLGVFAVTLYAAPLVKWLAGLALAGGIAWAATSIAGVLLGKSAFTGGQANEGKSKAWLNRVVVVAPYVFIVGLTILLASVLNAVLTSHALCNGCVPVFATDHFGPILISSLFNLNRVDLADVLWVAGGCLAVFGLLSWRVDINVFSLHGFYRNRLSRCYLGATRVGHTLPTRVVRKPHPFTGFDPGDDLPLSALAHQRPFPIVNAAMNLNGGEDLAWQTRRAASFAFTPLYTGFEFWNSDGDRISAYRHTEDYAADQFSFFNPPGGIQLGTVVATSGAATNPNMGYHTSAALSALLSVFNVRLGRWCGNPRHPTAWRKTSPRFGGFALLKEVFGQLNSRAKFLNVSDGGHFENLGIYELVRRRCFVVVAVDAGCDPDYQFEDLANAIRKCWTDFGTRIEIDLDELRPRGVTKRSESHFAVGYIHYPDALPGVLIYLKATLSGDESSDVKEYADRHDKFPNESTSDQFFDENQFESYRELGRYTGLKVFTPLIGSGAVLDFGGAPTESVRDALLDGLAHQLQTRYYERARKKANEAPPVDRCMEVTMMAITPTRGEDES
jgi:hypothetical protein